MIRDALLPGLPVERIEAIYANAPGKEIESGKFNSPEPSAALAANTFGLFLEAPAKLPPLPGANDVTWPATNISLEAIVRFPWSGGRHPCLDALIETPDTLIGVESKRYEPYRSKSESELSDAYWRPVWGDRMMGYTRVRDGLKERTLKFERLDAAQLVKHAFGLRTATSGAHRGKKAVLFYLYAEPENWSDGKPVQPTSFNAHRSEIEKFAALVAGDETVFVACDYKQLLTGWCTDANESVRAHARAVLARFRL